MKGRRIRLIIATLVICTMTIILAGCDLRIGYSSNSSTKKMSASFYYLSGTKEKPIQLEEGDVITFDYELKEKKGKLVATFEDSSGNEVYVFEPNADGEKEISIDRDDTYKLVIVGDGAKGSYKFEWEIN